MHLQRARLDNLSKYYYYILYITIQRFGKHCKKKSRKISNFCLNTVLLSIIQKIVSINQHIKICIFVFTIPKQN